MAELTTVARPYAKAAFQFANENSKLSEWSEILSFVTAVVKDDTVAGILDDPKFTSEQKTDVVTKICTEKLDKGTENFISLLASNGRLTLLPQIVELYEKLKAQQEQSVDVEIISAFEVSPAENQILAGALAKRFNQEVNIETKVDQSIIGGLIIRAGDLVIDGSVRGKLAKLAETMNS